MSYMDYSLNKALNKNYFKIFSFTSSSPSAPYKPFRTEAPQNKFSRPFEASIVYRSTRHRACGKRELVEPCSPQAGDMHKGATRPRSSQTSNLIFYLCVLWRWINVHFGGSKALRWVGRLGQVGRLRWLDGLRWLDELRWVDRLRWVDALKLWRADNFFRRADGCR